ncbi:MAG TPA: DUF1778 domain-containing protein [Acetobacteraceae bacterium]|nr:DUF1778 domain-containing protein [Acetobacteraceae bacterium]
MTREPLTDPLLLAQATELIVETIQLSAEDQRAVADSLLNPPRPSPAMVRAAERHKRLIRSGNEPRFVLDKRSWEEFVAEIDAPPADNPSLRTLLARKPAWED